MVNMTSICDTEIGDCVSIWKVTLSETFDHLSRDDMHKVRRCKTLIWQHNVHSDIGTQILLQHEFRKNPFLSKYDTEYTTGGDKYTLLYECKLDFLHNITENKGLFLRGI